MGLRNILAKKYILTYFCILFTCLEGRNNDSDSVDVLSSSWQQPTNRGKCIESSKTRPAVGPLDILLALQTIVSDSGMTQSTLCMTQP